MAPNILPLPDSSTQHVDDKGKPTKDFTNWLKSASDFISKNAFPKLLIGSPTGGDKGAGSVNAEKLYDSGSRVLTSLTGALLAANNLFDVANAATARGNLSAAAKAQTEFISGWFPSFPTNPTRIIESIPYGITITSFSAKLDTGSVTAALEINATPITGGSLNVTTTQGTATPSAANVMVATDRLQIRFSSLSTPTLMSWSITYTRTLA